MTHRQARLAASLAALAAWSPAAGTAEERAATDLIRAFYADVDAHAAEAALGAYFALDFLDHDRPANAPAEASDREAALDLFATLASGFPDGAHRLDILAPVGSDAAMVYWTFIGTHDGSFFGIPATGRPVEINGVDIFRVADGRFVEQWHVEELMGLFAQIGG